MSGTSLDGLDIIYCHIWEENFKWCYNIKKTKSVLYDQKTTDSLKNAIHLSATKLLELNNRYGIWLGEQVKEFINDQNIKVDFISSHGHTIHHQPENGFTYQIGSGQHLANASSHKVICDFRTNDVAIGGQGAPLVPIGDSLFFSMYNFCLNLGGISNISFEKDGKRIAYDVGLANMPLNYITQKHGLKYDNQGQMAKKGSINENMLKELNDLDYYKLTYPKSTGYEWFSTHVIPIIESYKDPMENLLRTVIEHNCIQIVKALKQESLHKNVQIFVTGGGALNNFYVKILQSKLENDISLIIPSKELIEFKEALVFALMGVLRIENKVNVLSSVTGASKDSSSGVVFLPQS